MQNWLCHLTVTKLTVQSSIASYHFMSVTYLHTEPLLEVLSNLKMSGPIRSDIDGKNITYHGASA